MSGGARCVKVPMFLEIEVVVHADVTLPSEGNRDEPSDGGEVDVFKIEANGKEIPSHFFTREELRAMADRAAEVAAEGKDGA